MMTSIAADLKYLSLHDICGELGKDSLTGGLVIYHRISKVTAPVTFVISRQTGRYVQVAITFGQPLLSDG